MKTVEQLSLADLIQLYLWYQSRYSSDSGNRIYAEFSRLGSEIHRRIKEIDFQLDVETPAIWSDSDMIAFADWLKENFEYGFNKKDGWVKFIEMREKKRFSTTELLTLFRESRGKQ